MSEATAAQIERREPLMKIRGLTKEFKIKSRKLGAKPQILHALSDVSLDVYEGETLGIIGESGCGKSTLGRTIIQLHKATAGTVEYQGRNIFELKGAELKALKKDIQMVFQDPYSSLDPRNTCEDIIAEPLKVHNIITDPKARQERVLELMREVGLDIQHMNRYPHEFSGGQRQRINVARALALKPKIIVCDEPVSALDVSIQAQVLNLFNRLQRQHNLTYIFISHDLGVIKHVSDRIAIMYLGRVVELCRAAQIYENRRFRRSPLSRKRNALCLRARFPALSAIRSAVPWRAAAPTAPNAAPGKSRPCRTLATAIRWPVFCIIKTL